jgi:hypothetical protein
MQLETKFLRLRTPVTIGSRFGDWRVCWLGGWTRDPPLLPSSWSCAQPLRPDCPGGHTRLCFIPHHGRGVPEKEPINKIVGRTCDRSGRRDGVSLLTDVSSLHLEQLRQQQKRHVPHGVR